MSLTLPYSCRLFGLRIDSDFPLPATRTAPAETAEADLVIAWSPFPSDRIAARADAPPRSQPTVEPRPDGGLRLIWPGEIEADLSADGRRISMRSRPSKLEFLPTVTIGVILGFALQQQRRLCLHATVLGRGREVVGFMGDSGAGKSTLAAWLLLRGARLYTDDMAVITPDPEGLASIQPGPTGLRLCRETAAALLPPSLALDRVPYVGKYLWDLSIPDVPCQGQFSRHPAPLSALYWLGPAAIGQGAHLGPALSAAQSLGKLIEALYPPLLRERLTSDLLRRLAQLAEKVPVRVIHYERNWEQLAFFEKLLP